VNEAHNSSRRLVKIRIFSDNSRGFTSQLECTRDQVLRCSGCDDSTNGCRTDKEYVSPSFLEETGRVTDGAEADAMGLRVEIFGNKLGEQQGAGLGVFGRLRCEKTIVDEYNNYG
jgi:hypothetical protein